MIGQRIRTWSRCRALLLAMACCPQASRYVCRRRMLCSAFAKAVKAAPGHCFVSLRLSWSGVRPPACVSVHCPPADSRHRVGAGKALHQPRTGCRVFRRLTPVDVEYHSQGCVCYLVRGGCCTILLATCMRDSGGSRACVYVRVLFLSFQRVMVTFVPLRTPMIPWTSSRIACLPRTGVLGLRTCFSSRRSWYAWRLCELPQ